MGEYVYSELEDDFITAQHYQNVADIFIGDNLLVIDYKKAATNHYPFSEVDKIVTTDSVEEYMISWVGDQHSIHLHRDDHVRPIVDTIKETVSDDEQLELATMIDTLESFEIVDGKSQVARDLVWIAGMAGLVTVSEQRILTRN